MGFIYSVSKTIYDNSGDLEIEYTLKDESFSHEFGTQSHTGYEIVSVKVWVPLMDSWIDVTLNYEKIEKFVNRLIEKDMGF